jgi:hypothetical protein
MLIARKSEVDMSEQAQTQTAAAQPRKKIFLSVVIEGEPQRAQKYCELLQMELETTIKFIDAMFSSAEPDALDRCRACVHETKVDA